MMKVPCAILFWFASFTTVSLSLGSAKGFHNNNLLSRSSLKCQITVECVLSREVIVKLQHHFQCNPVDNGVVSDFSYQIDLPSDFAQSHLSEIQAGSLFVNIPGGRIFKRLVHIPKDSEITVTSAPKPSESVRRRRQLDAMGPSTGTRSILVLRITALDATNSFSAKEIYSYIFNDTLPIPQPSLKSQYAKLSFGKLNFVPTKYGVMDVSVNLNATEAISAALRDAAIAVVVNRHGLSSITELADFVMICLPPGTGAWASSATVGGWRTVYNDVWCGFISAQMHELGHNLGLLVRRNGLKGPLFINQIMPRLTEPFVRQHSNVGSNQYMDFTSYMSAGFGTPYFPSKTFNGANNFQLGWYNDRLIIVNPLQGPQLVNLATFVDYGKSNKDFPVLIKIGNDTFLQYNRAKDFNYQAQQCIDQVTVVQQLFNGTNLWGCVEPTSPQLTIQNFGGTGQNLVIEACVNGFGNSSDPDWMQLSVGFDKSYCGQLTASPVASKPTSTPSANPTVQPTTTLPSAKPTAQPTQQRSSPPIPLAPPFNLTTPSPSQLTSKTKATPVIMPSLQPQQLLTPSTSTPRALNCYDSASSHFLVSGVTRTCTWLRFQPSLQSQLCIQSTIQLACPRTCKTCISSCVDQNGTFVNSNRKRTCHWLSLRPSDTVSSLCLRADVSSLCPVTCQSCPAV